MRRKLTIFGSISNVLTEDEDNVRDVTDELSTFDDSMLSEHNHERMIGNFNSR